MLHLVAVGVDRYADPNIPPLRCARSDAEALANVFRARRSPEACRVHLAVDEEATRKSWAEMIGYHLLRDVGEGDEVVIYVACRACRAAGWDGGETLYLLLHDSVLDHLAATATDLAADLMHWISRLDRARQIVLLLDTSFGGGSLGRSLEPLVLSPAGPRRSPFPMSFTALPFGVATAIVAVDGEQIAHEDVAEGHGLFTRAVLRALDAQLAVGGDTINAGVLYGAVHQDVRSATDGRQTPAIIYGRRGAAPAYGRQGPQAVSWGAPSSLGFAPPGAAPRPPPVAAGGHQAAAIPLASAFGRPSLLGMDRVEPQWGPQPPLPRQSSTLHASLTPTPSASIEPEQEVTFCVSFSASPQLGTSAPLLLEHPEGVETITVHASASSDSFVPPAGESWSRSFTVSRARDVSPDRWYFRAKALGGSALYTMTVTFLAFGAMVGALSVAIARRGAADGVVEKPAGDAPLIFPKKPGGARLTLRIAQEGHGYRFIMIEGGKEWAEPVPWSMSTDLYFSGLEEASGIDDLREIGYGIWVDLPGAVRRFLDRPEMAGAPTLIVSNTPVLPFEILTLDPQGASLLMGIERPVMRWVDDLEMPELDTLNIDDAACIRPEYPEPDALPSAAEEERELRERLPSIWRVRRVGEFDNLLNEPSIRLVHFAGHADGNPAKLILEDGSVSPARFSPSKQLLRVGRPLLFLNGCRAAVGRALTPSQQANMLKMLLTSRCTAAVAPLIRVQSAAALGAARAFYRAIAEGQTVGAAVQDVRRLAVADGAPARFAASYLSYLAFAPPSLRVTIPKGLTGGGEDLARPQT